jgi:hypothetical protein
MKTQKWYMIFSLFLAVGLALVLSAGTAMAQEVCNDSTDNDKDGLVDCADPECATNPKFCPQPPPADGADCSPGYYKKHTDTWDDGICCAGNALTSGTACNQIYLRLCAECGATAQQREDAKAFLDACFGTATASPCRDDD